MVGDLNMGSNRLIGLSAPLVDTDAATKAYVDAGLASLEDVATAAHTARVGAEEARTLAETARSEAEAARDAATVNADVYVDVATGLAAVSDGEQFQVVSDDGMTIYRYRHDAGPEAALVAEYPSAGEVRSKFTDRDIRVGYLWGVVDAEKRLALGLTVDGKLDIHGAPDVAGTLAMHGSKIPVDGSELSGYAWGVMDSERRLALALDNDGNLHSKGMNVSEKLGGIDTKWLAPSRDIATWGDSMTAGGWQPYLRSLLPGRSIHSGGVGGQRSWQIARRQGGVAPICSIDNNTIPSSGPVDVTVDKSFINSGVSVTGRFSTLHGTLTNTDGNYTFTRDAAGDPVEVDAELPFIVDTNDLDFRTTILWVGNNNYTSNDRPLVDGDVTAMVDFLKPHQKRFLVLGMAIASYPDRLIGTPYYDDIQALHSIWRRRWPDNFIDITSYLRRHYDPGNAQDLIDMENGCIPSSLRVDNIHLNAVGNQLVAQAIYERIITKGW